MKTLLLDRTTWDLFLDARGNIAVASDPYSVAQDVASAIRLFQGECWFDTTRGVPHFQKILGHQPPVSILKSALEAAALTVPEVTSAIVFISSMVGREIHGQVHVTSSKGTVALTGSLASPKPI
jgi:hypothetical protein